MFHPDPERPIFKGKRLLYMEESMFQWVMEAGAMATLFPSLPKSGITLEQMLGTIDGLLLSGGVDLAPESYGETAIKPEWSGDKVRDDYEIEVMNTALAMGVPVLGICRGAQVMNVALGGTMYQDITHQVEGSLEHRNWDIYDHNRHEMVFEPGTALAKLYGDRKECTINSIHHQGIKDLGKGLVVEARSKEDGIIEAIRLTTPGAPYCFGAQWHPEMQDPNDKTLLDRAPMMDEFLAAAKEYADAKR
jgi:putative glutamine amidotransferase